LGPMESVSIIINQLALLAFAVILVAAALSDVRTLTIPNRYTAAIALLYPVHVLTGPANIDWLMAIMIAAVVLLVCAGMFAFGLMGGGDAKMLAACALWAGPNLLAPFLVFTALAGGAVSLTIILRARYGWVVGLAEPDTQLSVPYGVAVASSGLLVAYTLFLSGY